MELKQDLSNEDCIIGMKEKIPDELNRFNYCRPTIF